MSKWNIAGAWVLVAALATTLTWQIVSAADAQVSDRPALQIAAPIVGSSTTSATLAGGSTSLTAPTTTTTAPGSTTSGPPGSSTTPPTEAAWASQTIQTGGGVVVVRYRDGEVVLGSASPAAGFAAEVKKDGPTEVDVEFESESAEYRVRAEWSGGELSVRTDSDLD
ncbi:MAG TPA: hypothetical protein VLA91_06365 [Acidimicrobiia bacterium]|nr:hypothetical protein [Acidimicrobiia bacterium]